MPDDSEMLDNNILKILHENMIDEYKTIQKHTIEECRTGKLEQCLHELSSAICEKCEKIISECIQLRIEGKDVNDFLDFASLGIKQQMLSKGKKKEANLLNEAIFSEEESNEKLAKPEGLYRMTLLPGQYGE
ncbi:uncharacterized protein MONOS_2025 [Monocercomonoides exilis]|uniref:uncharacterized protein n=1 Tax=Monocercomonoides exilis TaxID=2049356 RepID=UPI00355A678C|nr:hypothetical protein MONOS_2025 [Monocercomonoides exilis]|eukprot:MONOS_2025.1-p1 / transcript=MONOS_2025.1 / gene=MONOS_2025 / organism=Monocercomonoides_exilis_PA203 / gene_product=unspecified product / transcript_product=unspecified product / location=Mono_scaffold00039:96015-96638(-) / protein_length=132 / sequence_SO=supercontig / SO=protein_coding / is_pseudo=false